MTIQMAGSRLNGHATDQVIQVNQVMSAEATQGTWWAGYYFFSD